MSQETVIRLGLYFTLLIIGGIIGYKDKASERVHRYLGHLQMFCLFTLLFIMGLRIGIDEMVINNLLTIGVQGLIMTIATVVFSIIFVKIAVHIFKMRGKKV